MNKADLLEALRQLLIAGVVGTQEEICEALEAQGFPVNQSQISRLIRKIGAVKSKNESGQIVYRLPHEPAPPTVSASLASLILEIQANETTIMVYTSPGSAQLIARMLDYHKKKLSLMGCIAGDDTIFVAPRSIHDIETSLRAVRKLLQV